MKRESRFQAKKEQPQRFEPLSPEIQSQNLAETVLHAPHSLDSGEGKRMWGGDRELFDHAEVDSRVRIRRDLRLGEDLHQSVAHSHTNQPTRTSHAPFSPATTVRASRLL